MNFLKDVIKRASSSGTGDDPNKDTCQNKLLSFLRGTVQSTSPLRLLRGQQDILRIIWVYACSEWWSLHIQHYSIPVIQTNEGEILKPAANIANLNEFEMFDRKALIDCPLATIGYVPFPTVGIMPSANYQDIQPVVVNMMPFDLFEPELTLPSYLHGYLEMIDACRQYNKSYVLMKRNQLTDKDNIKHRIAYLTVDERPVLEAGRSQRREGVHVESPGSLRATEVIDKSHYTPDLGWFHHWGLGHSDGEYLVGGIFIASNMSNTTAVWNCRVHDTFGDIIGKHGSLERCRPVLGKPSKLLEAGELVWITDRTPHESLPVTDLSRPRQFFRLVVGEISFWFADHSTPNPTGYSVPNDVPIVTGNKFQLTKEIPVIWECGSAKEMSVMKAQAELRNSLYNNCIGFLADELYRELNIYNKELLYKNLNIVIQHSRVLFEKNPDRYSPYTRQFILHRIRLLFL